MDAVDGFSVHVEEVVDGPVLRLSGELDIATAPILRDCLDGLDGHAVTVDFSDVVFMDSSGVSVLVGRHTDAHAGKLILRGVQPAQMRLFEVLGLDGVLNFDGE